MNLVAGKCPNCGAIINVDSSKDAAVCEYCKTPFIVEKAIKNVDINIQNANISLNEGNINNVNNMSVNGGNVHIDMANTVQHNVTNIKKGMFGTLAEGISRAIEIEAEHDAKRQDELSQYTGFIIIGTLFLLGVVVVCMMVFYLPEQIEFYKRVNSRYNSVKQSFSTEVEDDNSLSYDDAEAYYDVYDGPASPSEADVVEMLASIDNILEIEAVTEENDSNESLNKPGGYSADIFFSSKYLEGTRALEDWDGNRMSPIDAGTAGGGSIEIYSNVRDAEDRCKYIHEMQKKIGGGEKDAIVGTCLVRISRKMKASKQNKLMNLIVDGLQTLD
ncbi:zinc ribbon domain-containing protein [Butyrivibrio sp. WCD3002]|uniref:zinc ribbon domain-containing protein n=1 Tax=Butyrivibrio sp. WCD3002 TaxID=1280676 RepID=UPI0004052162|nr:zinc ribbon domain-containing protein [Butyrivibrio sp. WCD3002]